jgi:cobyrinic acid a,c-diamide synthase
MRRSVRTFAEAGGGILAECGGLMYLTQAIVGFEGASHEMVGLFPAETVMERRGMTIGYREVRTSRSSLLGPAGLTCRGHEFHYSRLHARGPLSYCADLYDARGEQRGADGLVFRNVLAFYTHLHWRSQPSLVGSILSGLSGIAPTSSPV